MTKYRAGTHTVNVMLFSLTADLIQIIQFTGCAFFHVNKRERAYNCAPRVYTRLPPFFPFSPLQ